MKAIIELGKIDYYGNGRRENLCTLEVKMRKGRFSMCANVWNRLNTDILMGGQCCEEVVAHFPNDTRAQTLLKIWRDYHLNDMCAGSPAQRFAIDKYFSANPQEPRTYENIISMLEGQGLNPDPYFTHKGALYRYGSAWLSQTIPETVISAITTIMINEAHNNGGQ